MELALATCAHSRGQRRHALLNCKAYKSLFGLLHCTDEGILNTDPISLKDAYSGFKWTFEMKKKAKHWTEYHKVLPTITCILHILCKYCKATMSHPNHNGDKSTSNMHRHLEKYGPYTQYQYQYAESALDGLHACAGWNRLDNSGPMTSERLREMLL